MCDFGIKYNCVNGCSASLVNLPWGKHFRAVRMYMNVCFHTSNDLMLCLALISLFVYEIVLMILYVSLNSQRLYALTRQAGIRLYRFHGQCGFIVAVYTR
jgi:hypothetical protein